MKKMTKMTTPYEFVLKINENIICQRYFNVKKYNDKCRESLEMVEMLDDIMGLNSYVQLGIIPEFFKRQCIAKSWENYSPSYYPNKIKRRDNQDSEYYFNFDVLVDKEVVASSAFNATLFHHTIRYNIDIRDIIPEIVKVITHYMSLGSYTEKYGETLLNRHNKYEQHSR